MTLFMTNFLRFKKKKKQYNSWNLLNKKFNAQPSIMYSKEIIEKKT